MLIEKNVLPQLNAFWIPFVISSKRLGTYLMIAVSTVVEHSFKSTVTDQNKTILEHLLF